MKILLAPDKFKGTLSAPEAAAAMAEGVRSVHPQAEIQLLPIADGGEGTADILMGALGGTKVVTTAADPLFRRVRCAYGISADGTTAFIDLSQASGLWRLEEKEREGLKTTTLGTGELLAHAAYRKAKRILLGLGGSATVDCGMGIAHALGFRFMGENRHMLMPVGGNLGHVEYIDPKGGQWKPKQVELILLADTSLPLIGEEPEGGAMLFAAQKGVEGDGAIMLQAAFGHFANLIEAKYQVPAKAPGFGAAGGAALVCTAMLGARVEMGAQFVLNELGMDAAIHAADLVITGEGCLDIQSRKGKALSALAERVTRQGKPLVAVAGRVELSAAELKKMGIGAAEALGVEGLEQPYAALVEGTRRLLLGIK